MLKTNTASTLCAQYLELTFSNTILQEIFTTLSSSTQTTSLMNQSTNLPLEYLNNGIAFVTSSISWQDSQPKYL